MIQREGKGGHVWVLRVDVQAIPEREGEDEVLGEKKQKANLQQL
jgi:hypothetical protein